ncbi:tRNA pseudouridine(55) synthase TruB [Thiofilum flexile]|uniref:tRNA pseudouridine(55) synthase TruB n=1 Tax=Thiofilum flexile TaxID=125627 RepID=UPI0003625091|nr:tRNA pseudouridine(55) synthase TruB [Thiofilum flexile]
MSHPRRPPLRPVQGILLLDKPLGLSSSQALQQARFLFKAEKAGHTGSLDPLASGMLPLCFGEATKLSAYLLDADKRYLTTATLGQVSTTGDKEGVLSDPQTVPLLSKDTLEPLLNQFRGEIQQVPPMYSALKKDGKKLYELARQGIEVERPSRSVTISDLTLISFEAQQLTLDVACSKGTYIRTLVEDIGQALGCGAYVSALHRVEVYPFNGQRTYSLDELRKLSEQGGLEALDACLLPMDVALPHLPSITLTEAQVAKVQLGQKVRCEQAAEPLIKLYNEAGQFIGLGEINATITLQPKRIFVF